MTDEIELVVDDPVATIAQVAGGADTVEASRASIEKREPRFTTP